MFENVVRIFKFARKSQNMTQAELAEKLHISDKAWSKIETGVNQLEFQYIKPVCEILNLPYLEILQEIAPILPDYAARQQEFREYRVTRVSQLDVVEFEEKRELMPQEKWGHNWQKMAAYVDNLTVGLDGFRGNRPHYLMVTDSELALMQILAAYAGKNITDSDFGNWFNTLIQWSNLKGRIEERANENGDEDI